MTTTPDHLPDADLGRHPQGRVPPPKRTAVWLESRVLELERENAELLAALHKLKNELTSFYLDPTGQVHKKGQA